MLKIMGKKIFTLLHRNFLLSKPVSMSSKAVDVYIHTLMHIFVSSYKGQCYYIDINYGLKSDNLSFRLNLVFPILMAKKIFSQNQQAPGLDFRKVGKSLNKRDSKF